MKRLLPCLAELVLLFGGFGQAVMFLPQGGSIASAATYDLAADWSNAANPNGVWTYREGTNALPSVPDWTPLNSPVVQPAWAPAADGNFLPAWFKSTANNPDGLDVLLGDVMVHSTGPRDGVSSGVANVIWTSSINGVIDISGAAWMGRDIGRSNTWTLLLNGVTLTSGDIFSGDQFNRANPFDFSNGSGGPAPLNGIAASIGDVIQLRIEKTSDAGDFVGVNLTITEDSDGVARLFYLHGTGPFSNSPTLFLNNTASTAATAKFTDSSAINFSGGNPWKVIGTWPAASALTTGNLIALSNLHVWLGLKNSDDQGTRFDLRVEVQKNGALVAAGETHCIEDVTRNPSLAKEVTVVFAPSPPTAFDGSTDELSLKVLTRIGTNGAGNFCGGHSNAVGLRLYFDADSRSARFSATF